MRGLARGVSVRLKEEASVIPAKAGIQMVVVERELDSGSRFAWPE
jgi:hypothetical protein